MIKLNFQINKYYLAFTLVNKIDYLDKATKKQEMNAFTKLLLKYKDNPYFYLILTKNPNYTQWGLENIYSLNRTSKIPFELQNIYLNIFHSRLFKGILKETVEYKNLIKCEWKENLIFVKNYLEEIIGFNLPPLTYNIIIVHPLLRSGKVISKEFFIFGHPAEWSNYNTVYLTHELLHLLFDYYKIPENKISHALIELISDNELRIRLNKGGRYFYSEGKKVGHPFLKKIEKQMLPYWLNYLKRKQKNIIYFYKQLEKIIKVENSV